MVTVQNMQSKLEVWRNTSPGMRWYQSFDLQGRPTSKTVAGGKTFTITSFERQINQEAAAEPHMDLFRNGTFVIVKASAETVMDEIASPESLTDEEIIQGVRAVLYENRDIVQWLENITSPITLQRVLENLVAEDAPREAIAHVKDKLAVDAPPVQERVVVSTSDQVQADEVAPPKKGR